jgi:hypothetical protein
MEISKRNDLVKPRLGQCLQNYCLPVRKQPPYFLLNARSHFDMTLAIPFYRAPPDYSINFG